MKRRLLLLSIFAFSGSIWGQQQPGNADFENWDNSGANNQEPQNWNSMMTGDFSCTLCGSGQEQTIWEESGIVHSGNRSVKLETQQVLVFGLIPTRINGTVTLGQIGTTAADASAGYTRTMQNNAGFREVITGQPDSVVFWANYTSANVGSDHYASAVAILHETDPSDFFWNPESHPNYSNTSLNAQANDLFLSTNGWERKALAFDYNAGPAGVTTNKYLLLTFSSTDVPGAPGDRNGDLMYVDDVMLIYNVRTPYSFTSVCVGDNINVPIEARTLADGARTFTVQMSDASGSFAAPTSLGTVNVNDGDTCVTSLNISSFPSVPAGSGYKIRVLGDDPAFAAVEGATFSVGSAAVAGTATPTASTSCTSPNGQVAVSGGSGATSYSLYNSANNLITSNGSGSFTGLTAGDYYVTYANSCGSNNTANVTVNAPVNPTAGTLGGTNVTDCANPDGTASVTGATGGVTFEIFFAGGAAVGNTTGDASGSYTGLSAGDYEVVVTDGNGCTATTNSVTVGNASAPAAPTAGTDATYCEGDNMNDLTATAGAGGTLQWYLGGNAESTGATQTPLGTPGVHVYTVTETVNNCESAPTTVTVTVNPDAVAGTGTPTASTSCATPDGMIATSGGNGDTYELFTSGGTSISSNVSGSFSGLDAGDYYIVATNGCGTDQSATITVGAPAGPNAGTITPTDFTDCANPDGTVEVTGSNGTSFELFNSAGVSQGTDAGGSFTGLNAGDYYVVITDANGCTTTTATTTVADNTGYSVSIAPTATQNINTNTDGTQLDATESATAASREWMYSTTSGSGYMSFATTETGASYIPNFTDAGTYYVICESEISGCTVLSSEVEIVVTSAVGIEENSMELVNVYAFEKQMFVDLSSITLNNPIVKLYSADGKVVLEKRLNNGTMNTFNVDVPLGIYIFNIVTNDHTATGKVVLK